MKDIYKNITVALFVIDQNCKQYKYPLTTDWI